MKLIKPSWHTGSWTTKNQEMLIEELKDAEKERSLTNDEQEWLRQVQHVA